MDILLGQYKGLKATIPVITYTEDDVNAQIGTLLAGNPTRVNKEGPVAMGDTAVIDYEGFKDGVPFDGGKAEKYPLGIGSGAFIPGFEEQIVGMEIGEDRDINLSFPEQYHAPDLAGKEVVFKVKLHEIYSEKASELNDEFVVSLAIPEVKTVDDLKKHISEYLDYEVQAKKDEASREQLYDQILSASSRSSRGCHRRTASADGSPACTAGNPAHTVPADDGQNNRSFPRRSKALRFQTGKA